MTDPGFSEFGNTHALTHMLDSMRKGTLEVTHNGTPLVINKKLGEGGTKRVYAALFEDIPIALALPNIVDGVEQMTKKWKVALKEPENTERIRNMGLLTNPVCEILPVSINGVPFNALQMQPYSGLPYPIMDGKNQPSSTVTDDVLPSELDGDKFEAFFASTVPDMQLLIRNGVKVGRDSINICLVNGVPRLFLSDLGNALFEDIPEEDKSRFAESYANNAYLAFLNGLTEDEYQRNKAFFEGEAFKFSNPDNITSRIATRALV